MAPDVQELRRLVTLLEQSGMGARADVAALIDASRPLLSGMPPRAPRGRARAKLGALFGLLMDAAALTAAMAAAMSMLLMAEADALPLVVLLAAAAWGLARSPETRALIAGSGFWLRYHLRWAWLWLAEAFSPAAQAKLDALLYGREVMWAWRSHRRTLPHRPTPPDVEAFLAATYGPQAQAQWRVLLAEPAWTLRGGSAPPHPSLRWSFLIPRFEALAAAGALWAPPAAPTVAAPPPLPPAIALPAEPPEWAQRRIDLRDLIKRKREEINTAHGWKLKTPAEIAQRDLHLATLRDELRAMEAELAAMTPRAEAA